MDNDLTTLSDVVTSNKVNIKVEYLSFVTRPFVFTCYYSDLIKRLSEHSVSFKCESNNTVLINRFLSDFLNKDELPVSKEIFRYEPNYKDDKRVELSCCEINNLCKKDFILFLLDSDEIRKNVLSDDKHVKFKYGYKELLNTISEESESLAKKINMSQLSLKNMCDSKNIAIESMDFDKTKENFVDFYKTIINSIKAKTLNTIESRTFIDASEKVLKLANRLNDYADVDESLNKNAKIIAFVSKAGSINISIIKDEYVDCYLSNENYNSKEENQLMEEAINKSNKITGAINRLPKIFSFLDLNPYLRFKNMFPIYDNPVRFTSNDEKMLNNMKLSNKISTNKGVYLKFIIDDKYLNESDDSPTVFYDYVSLLVAYQHSYDEYTLWKYVDEFGDGRTPYQNELRAKITDYLDKPTEHLYFDDSLFTLSVIDETVNINRINIQLKNKLDKNKASHQARLYSFWDFLYVCNSLAYGSTCLLIDNIFIDYVKKVVTKTNFKPILNVRQAKLARIFSRIDANLNHTSFSSKIDANHIIDTVFDCIGLIRLEKYLNESSDINWRSGNLITSQTYQRYGLIFSMIGLFITIFSYGLVAKVADGKTYDDFAQLWSDIITCSPKILVILTVIAIPTFLWAIFYLIEYIYIRTNSNNIAKLDKFSVRRIKNNKK